MRCSLRRLLVQQVPSRRLYALLSLILSILLSSVLAGAAFAATGKPLQNLSIRWGVISNNEPEPSTSELTIVNDSAQVLPATGWTLYFNSFKRLLPMKAGSPLLLTHINGDFYKLEPSESFTPIARGASCVVVIQSDGAIVNQSLAPSGFYFTFIEPNGRSSAPTVPQKVSILPFVGPQQTNRGKEDHLPMESPELRYAANDRLTLLSETGRVVPSPVQQHVRDGRVKISQHTKIVYSSTLKAEARFLAGSLKKLLGASPLVTESTFPARSAIRLILGNVTVGGRKRASGDGAYQLSIDESEGISIIGTDAEGVFYGIQTLRELISPASYQRVQSSIYLDGIDIEDAPRFQYRGMHLDVARNFQKKEAVLKLMDLMALYKLNKLELHLADDEGWRLEIKDLPELTTVGGHRGHTTDESDRLVPSFGSGPDPKDSYGSGYYSRDDFVEILRYARARHIEVIPEIESIGHARAAIKSMQVRYNRLMAEGNGEAARLYLLHDPEDRSVYQSVQGWHDNVVNVCQPSALRFLEKVVTEIEDLYVEAGAKLTTVHIGGDEVPKGVWTASPACARYANSAGTEFSVVEPREYFLKQASDLLSQKGLTTAGWEEVVLARSAGGKFENVVNPAFLDRKVRIYAWNNLGAANEGTAYKIANAGYDVILSLASNLYFDLATSKDPEEGGNDWAGYVDARKPFELEPSHPHAKADPSSMSNAIWTQAIQGDGSILVSESGRAHIKGVQGQLWTETVRGQSSMEYFIFPRMLALAERAWSKEPAWEGISDSKTHDSEVQNGWNEFANRLGQRELERLSYIDGGVNYRLPPPGAVIEDGVLKANTAFPGLTIRYTINNDDPDANSSAFQQPVLVKGTVKLRTFAPNGRSSRTSIVVRH